MENRFYALLAPVGVYEIGKRKNLPSWKMDLELMKTALVQGLEIPDDNIRISGESMFLKKMDLYFIFQVMEITADYAFQMPQFPFRVSLNSLKRSKRKVRSLLWIVVIPGTSV